MKHLTSSMEPDLMDIDRENDAAYELSNDFGYVRGNPSIINDFSIVLKRVPPSEPASTVRGSSNPKNNRKRSESRRKRCSSSKITSVLKAPDNEFQRSTVYKNGESKMILCPVTDLFSISQDVCVMCGAFGAGQEGCLIACVQCGQCYHPYCVNIKVSSVILEKGWRCLQCTVCEGCGSRADESRLVLCDDCDISYHIYCMEPKLDEVPRGSWKCKWCARCNTCGAEEPGVNCSWPENFNECGPCSSRLICPVCRCSYSEGDRFIKCDVCERWLHSICDWFSPVKCPKEKCICVLCRLADGSPSYLALPPPSPPGGNISKKKTSTLFTREAREHTLEGTCVSEKGILGLLCLMNNAEAAESYPMQRYTSAADNEYLDLSISESIKSGVVDAKDGGHGGFAYPIVFKEHIAVESQDAKVPESAESFNASDVDAASKPKRNRKPGLEVEGFTPFISSRKLKENAVEDTLEKNLFSAEAWSSAFNLSANSEDHPKKKKSKQPESQLNEKLASFSQMETKQLSKRTNTAEKTKPLWNSPIESDSLPSTTVDDGFSDSRDAIPDEVNTPQKSASKPQKNRPLPASRQTDSPRSNRTLNHYSCLSKLSLALSGSPGPSMPDANSEPVTLLSKYEQRIQRARKDEVLGTDSTVPMILFSNTNHPELKTECPAWVERYRQIRKRWRALSVEEKQSFLKRAIENRKKLYRDRKAQKTELQSPSAATSESLVDYMSGPLTSSAESKSSLIPDVPEEAYNASAILREAAARFETTIANEEKTFNFPVSKGDTYDDQRYPMAGPPTTEENEIPDSIAADLDALERKGVVIGDMRDVTSIFKDLVEDEPFTDIVDLNFSEYSDPELDSFTFGDRTNILQDLVNSAVATSSKKIKEQERVNFDSWLDTADSKAVESVAKIKSQPDENTLLDPISVEFTQEKRDQIEPNLLLQNDLGPVIPMLSDAEFERLKVDVLNSSGISGLTDIPTSEATPIQRMPTIPPGLTGSTINETDPLLRMRRFEKLMLVFEQRKKYYEREVVELSNIYKEMIRKQRELQSRGDNLPECDVEELRLIFADIIALSKLCLLTRKNIDQYATLIKDFYRNYPRTKADASTSAIPVRPVAFSTITSSSTANVSGQGVQKTSSAANLFNQDSPTPRVAGSWQTSEDMWNRNSSRNLFQTTRHSPSAVTSQMQLYPRPQAQVTSQQSGDLFDTSSSRAAFHATFQPPSTAVSRMQLDQQLIIGCSSVPSLKFVRMVSEQQRFQHHAQVPVFSRRPTNPSIMSEFQRPRQSPSNDATAMSSQFSPVPLPHASPTSSTGPRNAFQLVPGAQPSSLLSLLRHQPQFACPPNADWSPQPPTSFSSRTNYGFQFVHPEANTFQDGGQTDASSTTSPKSYNNGNGGAEIGGNMSFTNVAPVPEEFRRLGIKPGLLGGAPASADNDETAANGSEAVATSTAESECSTEACNSELAPPSLNLPEDAPAVVNSSSTSSELIVSCSLDAGPVLVEVGSESVVDEPASSSRSAVDVDIAVQADMLATPCESIVSSSMSPNPMPVEIREQPLASDVDAGALMDTGLAARLFEPVVTSTRVTVKAEHTENGPQSSPLAVDAGTPTINLSLYSPSESVVTSTNLSPASFEIRITPGDDPTCLTPRVNADTTVKSCIEGALSSSTARIEMKMKPMEEELASVPGACDASTTADAKNDEMSSGSQLDVKGSKKRKERPLRKRKQRVKESSTDAPEKRIREVSKKNEDGHDSFVDKAFAEQLKLPPPLSLTEPAIRCDYSMYQPVGAGDSRKVGMSTWENGQLHGTYGSFTLSGEADHYSTQPFGDEELPAPVMSSAALDFYDLDFLLSSMDADSDETRTCRSDSLVSISSSSLSEGRLTRIPRFAGQRLGGSEKDELPNLALPSIPLVSPFALLPHLADTLRSCEDVSISLTLTFEAARCIASVLKNLAAVLNCAPPTLYQITERLSSPTTNPLCKFKGDVETKLRKCIDDTTKRCRYCRTSVLDVTSTRKKAFELPFVVQDNPSENLFFCSVSCYLRTLLLTPTLEKFEESDFPIADDNDRKRDVDDSFNVTAPAEDDKSGLFAVGRKSSKNLRRHRTWRENSIPLPAQQLARRPTESEMIKMLLKMGMTVRPSEMPEDTRRCIFCDQVGDGVGDGPSRLLNYDADKWAHLNCTLWSDVVYETLSGSLMNVSTALQYATKTWCTFCNKKGATVKCRKLRCSSVYHLPCALKVDCVFFENKTVFCATHVPQKNEFGELTTLAVQRKVFIPQDYNQTIASVVQPTGLTDLVRIGGLILFSIGQLLPHPLREFHDANFIYPIGYQVIRFYWSMRAFNKRCQYHCSIHDVAGRPQFRILVREPGHEDVEFRDATAKAVWTRVLAPLTELRSRHCSLRLYPAYLSGEDLFGLTEPTIARILEHLPGTEKLDGYHFKYDEDPVLRSALAANPSGCARCEPKQRGPVRKRARLQRTDSVGSRPARACDGTPAYPNPRRVVHRTPSQYMEMMKEWRNQVYLARSEIHGFGLFAAQNINRRSMVVEYVGEMISLPLSELRRKQYEAKNHAVYMFRLDEYRVVDATMHGNLARYINHSCDPNCVTKTVEVNREYHIIVCAKRKITYGEELTYSYQFDDENDAKRTRCLCGAANCRNWVN